MPSPDGGIFGTNLVTYNTSISMMGYGTADSTRSDLANTVQVLEAIYYSRRVSSDVPSDKDLN